MDENLKEFLNELYVQVIKKEHTCMITSKDKKLKNNIIDFIEAKSKENGDVFLSISMDSYKNLADKTDVKYIENFGKILEDLMHHLSDFAGVNTTRVNSQYENYVSKTIIPLLGELVKSRECYIIIKDFEYINTIFPDNKIPDGKQYYPLKELLDLSSKFHMDISVKEILNKLYVILLSDIVIEDVEIYKYLEDCVQSEWQYYPVEVEEM